MSKTTSIPAARDIARLHVAIEGHRAGCYCGHPYRVTLAACDATWALVGYDVRIEAGRDVQQLSFTADGLPVRPRGRVRR